MHTDAAHRARRELVRRASAGEWAALRGRWFYEWGTTSNPSVMPITSPATQFIITKVKG